MIKIHPGHLHVTALAGQLSGRLRDARVLRVSAAAVFSEGDTRVLAKLLFGTLVTSIEVQEMRLGRSGANTARKVPEWHVRRSASATSVIGAIASSGDETMRGFRECVRSLDVDLRSRPFGGSVAYEQLASAFPALERLEVRGSRAGCDLVSAAGVARRLPHVGEVLLPLPGVCESPPCYFGRGTRRHILVISPVRTTVDLECIEQENEVSYLTDLIGQLGDKLRPSGGELEMFISDEPTEGHIEGARIVVPPCVHTVRFRWALDDKVDAVRYVRTLADGERARRSPEPGRGEDEAPAKRARHGRGGGDSGSEEEGQVSH